VLRDLATLAATVGGILIGALGLYLNYRLRATALRERLHAEQLSVLREAVDAAYDCYVGAAHCLSSPQDTDRIKRIRSEWDEKTAVLQKASFRASAILPDATARALYSFVGEVNGILTPKDHTAPVPENSQLRASYWTFVSAARDELGIDTLTLNTKDLLSGFRFPIVRVDMR
jgi:hypothetical protein